MSHIDWAEFEARQAREEDEGRRVREALLQGERLRREAVKCPNCKGKGHFATGYMEYRACELCNGYGHLTQARLHELQHKPERKTRTMNYSKAVLLVNDNIRVVACSYEPDVKDASGRITQRQGRYHFKTVDTSLKVGDLVVVPTDSRHGMTVIKVEEVDVEVEIDDDIELKWIISKVDDSAYQTVLKEEAAAIALLKKAEKKDQKKKLKEKMLAFVDEETASKLSLSHFTENTAKIEKK